MVDRIEVERTDSDLVLSNALMYAGELLTKLVVAGLVAAIEDDSEKHTPLQSLPQRWISVSGGDPSHRGS